MAISISFTVSEIQRLLGGNFHTSHVFEAPVNKKTRTMGLSSGEIIATICLTVLTQYRIVTDRRTDTLRQHIPLYA